MHLSDSDSSPRASILQRRLSQWMATSSIGFAYLFVAACGLLGSEPAAEAAVAPPPTAFAPLFADAAGRLPGLEVVTRTDLRNLMGLETEKQLAGCETDSCLAEISDALGADLVFFLAVDQLGESIVVSTTLHTAKAELLGRRVINAESIVAISKKIPDVVDELVGAHLKTLKRKPDAPKLKMLINYKDAPKPKVPTTPMAPNVDYQAAIAAAQEAAERATKEAMARAEEMQRKAIEANRFPPIGFLGDVADVAYCLEIGPSRIFQSEARYRSWRSDGGDQAPTCKERYVSYGLYQGYDHSVKPCYEAARRAPEGIRDDVLALAKAIEAALPVIAKAEVYYDDEDYEEDDCALGISLHPKLMKAYKEVRAAALVTTTKFDDLAAERSSTPWGTPHQKALGLVVNQTLQLAAMTPVVGDKALKKRQIKSIVKAAKGVRGAMDAAIALAPPTDPDAKSAWTSTVDRLKGESRWFKTRARELKKGDKRLKRKAGYYDPTEIRLRALVLARELGGALPK